MKAPKGGNPPGPGLANRNTWERIAIGLSHCKADCCAHRKKAVIYDIEQLCNAQSAVYVISNPDGSDCEFLNLQQKASASELEQLRARWAGRNLHGVGVAFITHGIPRLVLKEEPPDFMAIVRLTAAFARYVEAVADDRSLQQRDGDEVTWLEMLYCLEDNRQEA